MKKIMALVLSLVLVMGLSVTAFAAESPSGEQVFSITFINGVGAAKANAAVNKDGTYTVKADTSKGKFDGWVVYKADGTVAKEGVDYVFTSGSANDADAVIKPLADIVICGNYAGQVTDPITGTVKTDSSPKTADNAVMLFAAVLMAAAACGFVAKKQLAK